MSKHKKLGPSEFQNLISRFTDSDGFGKLPAVKFLRHISTFLRRGIIVLLGCVSLAAFAAETHDAVICSLSCSAVDKALPSNDEIDRLCGPTNTPAEFDIRIEPYLELVWDSRAHFSEAELRRVERRLFTNALISVSNAIPELVRWNWEMGLTLARVSGFKSLKGDRDCLGQCLDIVRLYVPKAFDRSEFEKEKREAILADAKEFSEKYNLPIGAYNPFGKVGRNRAAFNRKWNPILSYNSMIPKQRKRLMWVLNELALSCVRGLSDDETREVIDFARKRGNLTDDEVRRLFNHFDAFPILQGKEAVK